MTDPSVIFFGISGLGVAFGLGYEWMWRREDARKAAIAACPGHDTEIRYLPTVASYKQFCRRCPFQAFSSREAFIEQEQREGRL